MTPFIAWHLTDNMKHSLLIVIVGVWDQIDEYFCFSKLLTLSTLCLLVGPYINFLIGELNFELKKGTVLSNNVSQELEILK
jgi:hypothetical protein